MIRIHRKAITPQWLVNGFALFLVLIAWVLMVIFFEHIPLEGTSLAIDWRGLWLALQGGELTYGTGLLSPPWSVLPMLPIGFLPMRAGWSLVTLLTLAVFTACVRPQSKYKYFGVLLLITSFPVLRTIADGNFEFLVVAGVLLLIYGVETKNPWLVAAGILLASSKPQGVWLLFVALFIYLWRSWPVRTWLTSYLITIAVVAPSLVWKGQEWLDSVIHMPNRGSIMDSSLLATSSRMGLPLWGYVTAWVVMLAITLYIVWKTKPVLSREKAGMLISASLLLAPYAAGNSILTVLAIGIIALFQARPVLGAILIALINIQYLAINSPDLVYHWGATYTTGLLLLAWVVFAWNVYRAELRVNDVKQFKNKGLT